MLSFVSTNWWLYILGASVNTGNGPDILKRLNELDNRNISRYQSVEWWLYIFDAPLSFAKMWFISPFHDGVGFGFHGVCTLNADPCKNINPILN